LAAVARRAVEPREAAGEPLPLRTGRLEREEVVAMARVKGVAWVDGGWAA